MSDSLLSFLKDHPFWAVCIIVFAVLPMVGAVLHIVLKGLGRRGIDNTTSMPLTPPDDNSGEAYKTQLPLDSGK
jgi:hypothetical protein